MQQSDDNVERFLDWFGQPVWTMSPLWLFLWSVGSIILYRKVFG